MTVLNGTCLKAVVRPQNQMKGPGATTQWSIS